MIALLALAACTGRMAPSKPGGDTAPDGGDDTGADDTGTPDLGTDPWTASLLPDGRVNLLLPYGVAVDPDRRRAYVASISFRAVVAVDLDTDAVAETYALPDDMTVDSPTLQVDGAGVVWVVNGANPAIVRVDPASGDVSEPDVGLDAAYDLAPLPAGGAVVSGGVRTGEGFATRLVRIGPAGAPVATDDPGVTVYGIAPDADGHVGALLDAGDGTTFDLFDADDLSVLESCAGPARVLSLRSYGDGTWISTTQSSVTRFDCDQGTIAEASGDGQYIESVVVPDGLLVVDHWGDRDADSVLSWVRRYTSDLVELDPPWEAGRSSSHGGWDPVLGQLWVNAEDATELVGIDADGRTVAEVRTGVHIEDVLLDPDHPTRVFLTGRLTDTVGWLDIQSGESSTRDDLVTWPVSPVLANGVLWFVGHTDGTVVGVDPATLEEVARYATGDAINRLHTFDDLAWDATRGLLWFANSDENALVGIDPAAGVTETVPLAGDPIDDSALPAQLQVIVADDGRIWTCRTSDGLVTRVDETGSVATGNVDAAEVDRDRELRRADACRLSEDGQTIWFWGHAFDADTLARDEADDVDATQVVAQIGDTRVAWDAVTRELRHVSADGTVLDTIVIEGEGEQPMFAWDADAQRLVYSDVMLARASSIWLGDWAD